MDYISSVFCLLTFAQLSAFSNGEPLFGNENVHIKVHVPEEVTHGFPATTIICDPANQITPQHHQRHKYPAHKPARSQQRHKQYADLLENILLSEFDAPTDSSHLEYTHPVDDINEHLTQHNDGYNSNYVKAVHKRPEKYAQTYKVIEYKAPIGGKNIYPTQHQHKRRHKPKTRNEIYKIVESKYLPPTAEGHELHNTAHYDYPVSTQTKPTKHLTNSKEVTYQITAHAYNGIKSSHTVPSYEEAADPQPLDDFKPNTNIYLPPYETPPVTAVHTDTAAYDLLTPKETLSLPTKEAEDFHGQFQYPAFNDGHFKPFVGEKYLPVGEEGTITQAAAETYTGIDSYSASHVQGLDHHSHSPYRRWSTLI